jgi:1-acylglycerone phosphate reductase
LRSRGLFVLATARTLDKITDLKGLGIECLSLVVNEAESVKACYEKSVQLLGGRGLDFIINNAGKCISYHHPDSVLHANDIYPAIVRPAVEIDMSEAKDMFGSNIIGIMDLTQTFFPQTFFPQILLAKRTIVNVGSVAGHMPLPFYSVFSATKAALYAYSECMRVELAPFGIKVVYIQAGNVKTDGMRLRGRTALNENSLFKPIEDGFLERQEIAATTGMDPDGFAKQLVQKVLTGTGKVIWIGESAFWCRAMNTLENFLPFSLWPFFFSQGYHMERLKT